MRPNLQAHVHRLVNVGSGGEELGDHLGVSLLGGDEERSPAIQCSRDGSSTGTVLTGEEAFGETRFVGIQIFQINTIL